MKRNSIGAVLSVKSFGEFNGQYMSCQCHVCGEIFTTSDTEDVFVLREKMGEDGECPLSCESCHDKKMEDSGIPVIDLGDFV